MQIPRYLLLLLITHTIVCHAQMTGSEFAHAVEGLSAIERDSVALAEIISGNVPNIARYEINDTLEDANGIQHAVQMYVLSDVVAVGTDSDFLRIPMLPSTAQRVADLMGGSLPTRRMSDLIHRHATVKLSPHPMTPDATMTTVPVFARHNEIICDTITQLITDTKSLIAGHKKDIVITNRMAHEPGRVFIYGWHYPNGKPIQPLSGVHGAGYTDYSHGVRIIFNPIIIDNQPYTIDDILRHPTLFSLLSDEDAPMTQTKYPN